MVAIAAGSYHSLALGVDGTVWTWGANSYGQLGDGTTTPRSVPVQVLGLDGVVAISAGYYHSLALRVDGSVWAWGDNLNGQLGDGTTTRRFVPVRVPGLSGVVALGGGGRHSLALGTDGAVWVWGSNSDGQLGNGQASVGSSVPVRQQGLSGVVALDGGDAHSLVQRTDGTLWAWGDNGYGQVGNATLVDQLSPLQVLAASARGMVAAGTWFSYVLRADGTLWGFGLNENYQIGSTSPFTVPAPVQMTGISNIRAVSAGHDFILALRADGTVWGWGNNGRTQLGDGTSVSRSTPTRVRDPEDATGVKPLGNVAAVSAGFSHSLALRSDGTVWAWGYNDHGQIGDGSTASVVRFVPVKVPNLTHVVAVAAGGNHSLALSSSGTVWAWGQNADGQLGIGSTASSSSPVQVPNLEGVVAVVPGAASSLALKADGTVWAWGNNQFGQLGNGQQPVGRSTPARVMGIDQVVALTFHNHTVLALRADGTLWGWGYNHSGQVGTGTPSYSAVSPVRSVVLDGLVSISGGTAHSLVMRADGSVWSWGNNGYGQLGDSTLASHTTPFLVPLP
jgi:alpha-tubulin suppressor-like RCC1 family protein